MLPFVFQAQQAQTLEQAFQTSQSNLVLMIVLFGVVFSSMLIVICAWGWSRFHKRKKEGLNIDSASDHGQSLALIATSDKWLDIKKLRPFVPEGIHEITPPVGKGPMASRHRFRMPWKRHVEALPVQEGKDAEKTAKVFNVLNDLNNEPSLLRYAKVPLVCAVENRAIAVRLKFLGALSFIEKMEKLETPAIKAQLESIKETSKDVYDIIAPFITGFSGVDFNTIYANFNQNYDQTLGEEENARERVIGAREAKNSGKENAKLFIIGGIIIAIAGLATGAVLAMSK